jgi:hypothetical protein
LEVRCAGKEAGMSAGSVLIPAQPRPMSLAVARLTLPASEFRRQLRAVMLADPRLTLRAVAADLGVTRQRVGGLVGKLDRLSCSDAHYPKPAPKRKAAKAALAELERRVRAGESAERAAGELGISLGQAMRLGFRSRAARPPHGTWERAKAGCDCWRCRRVAGVALPRGPRTGPARQQEVLDWLAWRDPDDGTALTQREIGRLVGVRQPMVSRIARAISEG